MLSFSDLALISALASTGRPRKAAEVLRTHPATIYRRLKALELQLGAIIFDKLNGAYVPSPVGREILARAQSIDAQLAELNRHLSGRDARFTGTITVTTTDTLASHVSSALAAFRGVHPEILLQLVTSNAMADIGRHEADVAVRPTQRPPDTLIGRRVGEFGYGIYASRDILLTYPDAGKLPSGPWICLDATLAGNPAAQWITARIPADRIALRTNSMLTAMEAARRGLGLALLPTYLGDDPHLGLVRIGEQIAELRSDVWVLTHPDLMRAARIKVFTTLMVKYLKPMLREGGALPCPALADT